MTSEHMNINQNGYLTPEFIASKEGQWVNRDGKSVWIVCGDERGTDDASVAELSNLMPEALPINEGGLSVFGQVVGVAKNALAVGVALYGEDFYDNVGGLIGMVDKIVGLAQKDTGVGSFIPAQHSDAAKEKAAKAEAIEPDDTALFCAHGSSPLGCAYCNFAGPVSELIAENDAVYAVGKENIEYLFGEQDDRETAVLRQAHAYVTHRIGKDFAFDRQRYATSSMPVQILQGIPHLPAAETGLIVNLDPHTVGKAGETYRSDVAGVALIIRRLLPEYNLDAGMLIKSQILEAAAVRAALASGDQSGDTTPDPRRIGFGVRGGTINDALLAIEQLEKAA